MVLRIWSKAIISLHGSTEKNLSATMSAEQEFIYIVFDTQQDRRSEYNWLGAFRSRTAALQRALAEISADVLEALQVEQPLNFDDEKTVLVIVEILEEEHIFIQKMLLQ
jgi:hypothetical protein